ncbi:MAG: thymidine phosphorylase, partial [Erysipelotrichaceae bacterium]|nr:thymidine phosphorylase [Erysipelotrichaceae bacterium]
YTLGDIPDYQVSAFLMAIYFQGMDEEETAYLTQAMMESGEIIDLKEIDGIICDKHSTGGVGDKTSLSLLPMVAACGVKIAKMSGRGLGHTGGTLDKVESIKGFQIQLEEERFKKQVNTIGIAIVGQSNSLVPADKKLYALRDVTATVNSLPLIASSIMAKKLASGADKILLDVKFGSGAFMEDALQAEALAQMMIKIGNHLGKEVNVVISNMNQPLGNAIGNALEVKEAIATLCGEGPKDFEELCIEAGSIMLLQGNIVSSLAQGEEMLRKVIENRAGFKKLQELVEAQGGDIQQILDPQQLPKAASIVSLPSIEEGYVKCMHTLELGVLAMKLGAGRSTKEDVIDPAVGIVLRKKVGDYVKEGEPLAEIHTNFALSQEWKDAFYQSYVWSKQKVEKEKLIYKVIRNV